MIGSSHWQKGQGFGNDNNAVDVVVIRLPLGLLGLASEEHVESKVCRIELIDDKLARRDEEKTTRGKVGMLSIVVSDVVIERVFRCIAHAEGDQLIVLF